MRALAGKAIIVVFLIAGLCGVCVAADDETPVSAPPPDLRALELASWKVDDRCELAIAVPEWTFSELSFPLVPVTFTVRNTDKKAELSLPGEMPFGYQAFDRGKIRQREKGEIEKRLKDEEDCLLYLLIEAQRSGKVAAVETATPPSPTGMNKSAKAQVVVLGAGQAARYQVFLRYHCGEYMGADEDNYAAFDGSNDYHVTGFLLRTVDGEIRCAQSNTVRVAVRAGAKWGDPKQDKLALQMRLVADRADAGYAQPVNLALTLGNHGSADIDFIDQCSVRFWDTRSDTQNPHDDLSDWEGGWVEARAKTPRWRVMLAGQWEQPEQLEEELIDITDPLEETVVNRLAPDCAMEFPLLFNSDYTEDWLYQKRPGVYRLWALAVAEGAQIAGFELERRRAATLVPEGAAPFFLSNSVRVSVRKRKADAVLRETGTTARSKALRKVGEAIRRELNYLNTTSRLCEGEEQGLYWEIAVKGEHDRVFHVGVEGGVEEIESGK